MIAKVPAKEIPRLTASSFTPASDCLCRAKQVYSAEGILGSDENDVVNSNCAKVAGAEVDSSPRALDLRLVLIGAPKKKRLSLASIALQPQLTASTSAS